MTSNTRPQTWQLVNEEPLEVLETGSRESLDNLLDILNSKMEFPFRVSLSGSDLTIHQSEFQTYRSDESEFGGVLNSFKVATAPIQGQYTSFVDSTLAFSNGAITGSFSSASGTCPALGVGEYVYLGLQATSNSTIDLTWGNPNVVLGSATKPTFATGTAVCLIKLQATATTLAGVWGTFGAILPEDIIMFKGSGGGGGGGTDFVPVYKSSLEFKLLSTQGRQSRFNEKYYSIGEDLDFTYGVSDGSYYICIDTNNVHNVISSGNKSLYIKTTKLDPVTYPDPELDPANPNATNFPANLVALGWYSVAGGLVTQSNLGVYSTREVDTAPSNLHFVPYFISPSTFGLNTTQGKYVFVNGQYYGLDHDTSLTFATASGDGTYYICLNTGLSLSTGLPNASGLIAEGFKTDYFVMTTIPPTTNGFNPYYAPLGQYTVTSGVVSAFQGYSTREMISWVYGIPNMKRTAKTVTAPGIDFFDHNLNAIPSAINYHYWDSVNNKFEELDRWNIEQSFTINRVDFDIPVPLSGWAANDYVIIEVLHYAYTEAGGFASPKTDVSTEWVTTPDTVIYHNLIYRPRDITLEFHDVINNIFWVEDGNQYVDKNAVLGHGGIEFDRVTFDWSTLPTINSNLTLTVSMHLSKISAGAFEASKIEKGVVSSTGITSVAVTPDIILKSTDINFGTKINASLGNVKVLVTETITVTSQQIISVPNVSFDMLPGTFISNGGLPLSSVVQLSGSGYEVENMRILTSGDTSQGLVINAEGIIKNITVYHDGALGNKLETAVRILVNPATNDAFIATVNGRAEPINGGNIHYILKEDSSIFGGHSYSGNLPPANEGDMRPKVMISGIWSTAYRA